MVNSHPQQGTLPGLAQLLTETFDKLYPDFDDSGAGETLILTFENTATTEYIARVEEFLTEHGARYTRLTNHDPTTNSDENILLRVVLDDDPPTWDLNPDTRIQYTIEIDDPETRITPDDDPLVTTINSPVSRSTNGVVTLHDHSRCDGTQNGLITKVTATEIDTLVPQPASKKIPPTVSIHTPTSEGEFETVLVTDYTEITEEHGTVTVESQYGTREFNDAVISSVSPIAHSTLTKYSDAERIGPIPEIPDPEHPVETPLPEIPTERAD